jgi:release factor glutamine methyltransferase
VTEVAAATIRQRIDEVARRLAGAGIEAPQAEAEGLLGAAVGINSRHALYLEERDLTPAEAATLEVLVTRRLAGEPLQYITGEAAFRLLTLIADRRALIPRPETEGLVEVAIRLMGSQENVVALDAGAGGGAIALSLAHERPTWMVIGVELSPAALELARQNARRHQLERIQWFEADVTNLGFWRILPPLDLVISNPPYVADSEWDDLPVEIREHEPQRALLAGADGLDVIRPLLEGAAMRVKPGGLLVTEVGETQGEAVVEQAQRVGFVDVRIAPDLSARPRYLIAEQRRSAE